jgi:HrpA-like RNA helicase
MLTSIFCSSARDQIIKGVQENDTVVIVGETGSGKTTRKN